jgi:hypothetical protein
MKTRTTLAFLVFCICPFFLSAYPASAMEQIQTEKILETSQAWKDNYLNYRVDESLLDTLKSRIDENLTIDVYLGTWCIDSQNNVPPFIRIIEMLNIKDLPVRYFNMDRKPSRDIKFFVEEFKVERVPTFIFYRQGEEIGRIVENPEKSLMEDIIELL